MAEATPTTPSGAGRSTLPPRAAPWLGDRRARDGHQVVVLPTAVPVAYGIGGRPGQVVVSEGLLRRLSPDQAEVVVRHEEAHLRRAHPRWFLLAAVADSALGVLPWVRRATAALRVALERWADEDAAGPHPGTRQVLRRALQDVAADGDGPPPAARRRAEALARPPAEQVRSLRLVAVGGLVAGTLVAGASLIHWLGELPALLAART
ncbi:MAG: M56 family metallopeptidase [Acidimicrobiales bacterium]